MQKKELILVTWGFPFGEKEQSFLRAEFDELVKHYQITILTTEKKDSILYPIPDAVRVKQYSYRKNSGKYLLAATLQLLKVLCKPYVCKELLSALCGCPNSVKITRLKELLSFALQAEQLKRILIPLLEETGANFVYTYWCYPITLTAAELKKKYTHLKVLTRFHGADLYNERLPSGWQPFRTAISKKCDRLVFACEAGRDYYLSHWGQEWAAKSLVSYLGCHPMERIQCQESDGLTMISCSGAIQLKRIHLIIEALALLPKSMKVTWHHIGDGVELERLKNQAQSTLACHPNIQWKFWGYIPNKQLELVYQQIGPQLFITTTSTEGGAPVSIQEIFAAGIPAIGSAVGGIPELVRTDETGYLLPENPSPQEVSEAIAAFYTLSPERRQAMSDAAYALWEEKLNARKNAVSFVEFLEHLHH